ncbi:hypothetical protein EYY95_21745 [Hafnia alvei]|uniref:hypothetical protein n=1 Tax=Hafnia alvei TaxID=569 RepID=UPI0010339E43|nr:hypothetical protein EYY95_21745 [Hafnia alvei]
MEHIKQNQLTLSRIQFIADVSQSAQCSNSEFKIAMSLISELVGTTLESELHSSGLNAAPDKMNKLES